MVIRKTSSPELTSREAAYNMALLIEHEKESGRKVKRELYFGVYCSRSFIAITRSTSLIERIKRYIQWLIGSISYSRDAIDNLAARSRKHWVPANELKAKKVKLEEAEKKLAKAQHAEEKLQKAEQDLQIQRQANGRYINVNQQWRNTSTYYQNQYLETRDREYAKDAQLIQQRDQIFALRQQLAREQNEHQTMERQFRHEWDVQQAALIEARRQSQRKDHELTQLRDRIRSQLQAVPRRQSDQLPAGRGQGVPAVTSQPINSSPQDTANNSRGIPASASHPNNSPIAAILSDPKPPSPQ